MEQQLNSKLEEMQKSLHNIEKSLNPSRWNMLVQGLWRGVGYLIGLVIAVALLGWMLNAIGVIPFLNTFSQDMKEILNNARIK